MGGRWSRNAELSRTAIAARGSQLIVGKREAVCDDQAARHNQVMLEVRGILVVGVSQG